MTSPSRFAAVVMKRPRVGDPGARRHRGASNNCCGDVWSRTRVSAFETWAMCVSRWRVRMIPRRRRHQTTTDRILLVWASAVIAVVSLAVAAFAIWNRPTAVQKTAVRLTIPLPPGQELTSYPAITRDGQTVAYVTRQGTDDAQLYLRDLSSFEPRAVAGSSGALQPFFSPDGKWVAFFAQGQLQKAEVSGGAPIRLAEALNPFGGTWNDDNTIIYAASLGSGLLRIPASGGTPESADQARRRGTGVRARLSASPSRADEVSCSRSGDKRREPRCCRWIRADGMSCCPRRGLPSGMFEATGGSSWSHPARRSDRRHQGRSVRRRAPRAHQRRCVGPHRRVLRRGKRNPWAGWPSRQPVRLCTPPATRHAHRWYGSTGKERSNRWSRTRICIGRSAFRRTG